MALERAWARSEFPRDRRNGAGAVELEFGNDPPQTPQIGVIVFFLSGHAACDMCRKLVVSLARQAMQAGPFRAKFDRFDRGFELASTPAIVRAAHLNAYVGVLRGIGFPVERALARSRLPSWIEELPDAYVSVPLAMEWVGASGKDFSQTELGFRAAQQASLQALRPQFQTALAMAPTGLMRLRAFVRFAASEDSALHASLRREGQQLRIFVDMERMRTHPFVSYAEWLNVQGVISVIRSVAGEDWCPAEITFVSPRDVADEAQASFPNTRFLTGQAHTSVLADKDLLARPTFLDAEEAPPLGDNPEPWHLPGILRSIVQPYLAEGYPDLASTAEIVGLSTRTLQRRLQSSGTTYSGIVEQARLGLAMRNLRESAVPIVDVAHASGYENPQHFARAFRRVTGVTPTAYRRLGAV